MGVAHGFADHDAVVAAIGRWIDDVVVGLRLCPFASGPWKAGEVRIIVSAVTSPEDAVRDALDEALHLMEVSEDEVGTTLVAFTHTLDDFETFLDAEETLAHILDQAGASGILQVASFHPDYVFADAEPDALGNWTNRAPVPILHLLREAQVTQAIDQHPDPDAIPNDNVKRLEALGHDALVRLWRGFSARHHDGGGGSSP
jgi:hypothetical protein